MKSLTKTVILFLMILLTSCSSSDVIENVTDKPSVDIQPIDNEIITIPVCADQIPSEEVAVIINEILESKYNVKFDYTLKLDITQTDVANFDGLVFLGKDKFFEFFTNRVEIMLPMTSILPEIEEWSYLPDRFQKAFTQFDNENWAVPAGEAAHTIFPIRAYNSNILSSLNRQIPSNTDELMELLSEVKENYPNVDPIMISGNSVLSDSSDILNAFGVPAFFSGRYFSQIAYNYTTGGYEDIVMDENFVKAITFIKTLYSEELVNISDYTVNTTIKLFNGGVVFSRFGMMPASDDEICNEFSPSYGSYLLNDNYELPYIYQYATTPMIVLGGKTKEPQKILGALIKNFYTNQEGVRDVSYGLAELDDYEISIKNNMKSVETEHIKFLPMNISSLLDEPEPSEAFNNKQALSDLLKEQKYYINSMPNTSQLQKNNFFHDYMAQYTMDKKVMFNVLNSLVIEYIESNISSEEFMEKYLAEMKNINAEDIINDYNKALNLKEFSYNLY